jgi:hypothetical protein
LQIPQTSGQLAIESAQAKEGAPLLRGGEGNEILRMRQEGVCVSEISRLLEVDPKTVRKYLKDARSGRYVRGKKPSSPLWGFLDYGKQRLAAGVWNAVGLTGSYVRAATPAVTPR